MFLHSKTDNYSSPRRRLELRLGGPALASTHREAVELLDLQGKKMEKIVQIQFKSGTYPHNASQISFSLFDRFPNLNWHGLGAGNPI